MNTFKLFSLSLVILSLMFSCKNKPAGEQAEPEMKVLVKTVSVEQQPMVKDLTFNGQTVYLNKNTISSPISGYALKVNTRPGTLVKKDQVLFEIQTRENKALNSNDGIVKVLAPGSGYISEVNVLQSDVYLTEGSPLCTLVATNDVTIKASIPYENLSLAKKGTSCKINLPDGSSLGGLVTRILPVVEPDDQTLQVWIQPANTRQVLPENLNLLIQVVAEKHPDALVVPSNAVMSNETVTDFWVMKLVDGNRAVQVKVDKGIRNDSLTEIISPDLQAGDVVISEGAYGLPDSSIVEVIH